MKRRSLFESGDDANVSGVEGSPSSGCGEQTLGEFLNGGFDKDVSDRGPLPYLPPVVKLTSQALARGINLIRAGVNRLRS